MAAVLFGLVLVGAALLGAPRPAPAGEAITVFAAASLKTALDEISALYAEGGGTAVVSLGGSAALARQIQYGAPAQVFISANTAWMDALESGGLIDAASRVNLLTNRLVLIAGRDVQTDLAIAQGFDLAGELGSGKLAMALVDAVPAGIYGKSALQSLGVWDAVEPKVAQADNVRAALMLVAMGETDFGIVYATDAAADPRVRVIGLFPPESHPPILYPAAVVAGPAQDQGQAFLDFLRTPAATEVFLRQGFGLAESGS
ncbi:molybdate ABC transporter substrate-binding protein [Sedimentitalea sp. JM2-8]|uniref:Molybdate ABC transporter substrate-binding protein n=2 Tax=Sedimentitalea xiamensis TaxID=3050037 RepID=A0ABT7FET6_9RHOB|nr:molybdate ABC transporter substrate-binding protein [Sedimentitalea xiamensis]